MSTITCYVSAKRAQLSSPNLHVVIDKHSIIERTFLMPDYVMYHLEVHPLGVVCKRNYDDFLKLKNILSAMYPGLKLSYLESNSWFNTTSIEFIKRQKQMLEYFINDLIRNKEIRNSRFFEEFLTLTEHKQMKRKFEEYDKLDRPKAVEELCLLSGTIPISIT